MMLFPVLYVGAKLWTRAPLVPYTEMDFKSGLQEVLDASYVTGGIFLRVVAHLTIERKIPHLGIGSSASGGR